MDAIRTVIIFSPVSEKYIGSADLASFSLVLSSSVIISTLMFGFIEQSYERGYGVSETLNKIVNTGIPIILLIFLALYWAFFKGQTLFEIIMIALFIGHRAIMRSLMYLNKKYKLEFAVSLSEFAMVFVCIYNDFSLISAFLYSIGLGIVLRKALGVEIPNLENSKKIGFYLLLASIFPVIYLNLPFLAIELYSFDTDKIVSFRFFQSCLAPFLLFGGILYRLRILFFTLGKKLNISRYFMLIDNGNNPTSPVLFIFSSSLVYSIALNTLKPSIELVFIPIIPLLCCSFYIRAQLQSDLVVKKFFFTRAETALVGIFALIVNLCLFLSFVEPSLGALYISWLCAESLYLFYVYRRWRKPNVLDSTQL